MSLKQFHIVFIICSIVLAIFFGCWALSAFRYYQQGAYLLTAVLSWATALGLAVYCLIVAKKLRNG